ncbi:MAG: hypothetical protein OHK0032_08480 [Thermodesulfovibrionales bacterium]
MDIMGVLKEGIEVSRKNYIIFVPTIAVMVLISVLTLILIGSGMISMGFIGGGMRSPGAMVPAFGTLMGGMLLISILGMILGLFAHGMTVGMAKEAIDAGSTSISSGINIATSRFAPLLLGAFLVGIIVAIGLMLLIIPGLIAAFLLMFTFVAIVIDSMGPVEGMKKSFEIVKSNLGDVIVLFVVIIVLGVVFGIVNMILNIIPILGQLLGMALMGVFGGYISIVMVMVYRELAGAEQPAK